MRGMTLVFSDEQHKALSHTGSCLLVGTAGTGKTTLLLEKTARAVQKYGANQVAVLGFAWRSTQLMKAQFAEQFPQYAGQVFFGTIRDVAHQALEKNGTLVKFIPNHEVRALIQKAMVQEKFEGTLEEAEHIIRTFRSRLKNPQESERHYPLFVKYRELIDATGGVDRHTMIRKHILAMDKGEAEPAPVQAMVVDNMQDATPLQKRWLQTHLAHGVTLLMAGNDDLTAFGLDGAMGAEALREVADLEGVSKFELTLNYRTPPELLPALSKLPRLLRERVAKTEKSAPEAAAFKGHLQVFGCDDRAGEINVILQHIQTLNKRQGRVQVGLIVRDDQQANELAHLLNLRGIRTANWARLVWENPAAHVVLDILYVLLNQAKESQLFNVLSAFGVGAEVLAQLAQAGVQATGWLAEEAPIPANLKGEIGAFMAVRRQLLGMWSLLRDRKTTPREAFKALVFDVLTHAKKEDKPLILLALDMLLHVDGPLVEKLQTLQQETLPDMASPIVVAPVREVRNMQFQQVILPFANDAVWPPRAGKILGTDMEHERRLFYLAVSRTQGGLIVTHTGVPSLFVQDIQAALKTFKKPSVS
ncbi:MAG: UvrD-helicase domain-containing protein [Alphaproteobacteria bacterium]